MNAKRRQSTRAFVKCQKEKIHKKLCKELKKCIPTKGFIDKSFEICFHFESDLICLGNEGHFTLVTNETAHKMVSEQEVCKFVEQEQITTETKIADKVAESVAHELAKCTKATKCGDLRVFIDKNFVRILFKDTDMGAMEKAVAAKVVQCPGFPVQASCVTQP